MDKRRYRDFDEVEGYKEYYRNIKEKKEEWDKKITIEIIDEIISPRVLVFPIQFENIAEISLDDVKVKEFKDIDEFEIWIKKEGKRGKYLLVHNLYREFLLYIKDEKGVWVINLRDINPPERFL